MKTIIQSLIASALLFTPIAASAQETPCGLREDLVAALLDQFGENFSGGGLKDDKAVYEIWTSEEAGTWTLLLTRPNGISCILASGTDWQPQLARHIVKGVKS
ncbi:hypothetical protein [Jannaschia seohaensis]|uniref:Uncharacterized protein n=1 Tax=Jannaschia seohaensis TaxID=475081 RepID=A0A2Y9B4S8_9RHOB|nr:hypothetical protein [Jannaschia seohaensis]PWJ11441.1 hypothetical protein BCF38_1198 [Jannaschia seohaensis]SSA51411.1 hypothetical protein SAMN05421539_1198 [Jannaschia seohaensis]